MQSVELAAPLRVIALANANAIELAGTKLFFYEVYEHEYDSAAEQWKPFAADPSFKTQALLPIEKILEGFDVVTSSAHTSPECLPLSCNSLAAKILTTDCNG